MTYYYFCKSQNRHLNAIFYWKLARLLEMQGYCFYSINIRKNSTKKRTSATTTQEGKCVLICAFIGSSRWPLLGIIRLFCLLLCAPLHYWAVLCVPVRSLYIQIGLYWTLFVNRVKSCGLYMASNRPLLQNTQPRAFSILQPQINLSRTLDTATNQPLNDLLLLLL